MNLWQRLTNLYKLSEYVPGKPEEEYKTPGTQIAMIVKKPEPTKQTAQFIPRIKKTPIEQINEASNQTP